MVDCGLVQGGRGATEVNEAPFAYKPGQVDVLLVTHAHADHIGRIPKLIKDGFVGKIYSTKPTRELAEIMLTDAAVLIKREADRTKKPPLYRQSEVDQSLKLWSVVDYDEAITLPDDITAHFTDAGHILGSGLVHLTRHDKKIVFTGDVGNDPQPLLAPPTIPKDYDYLVMESVYGDRSHEQVMERSAILQQHILDTIDCSGTLIIPAFSLERTQGILFEINNLVEQNLIPLIKTYLDSPLAIRVTDVYRQYTHYLKPAVQKQIADGDDIFEFAGLSLTMTAKESRSIMKESGPKIIMAGSGMSHGGRILEHEKHYLSKKDTTLLLVGYQTVGSVGRLLQEGVKQVKIDNQSVKVRAKVAQIRGYSGHADREQLLDLVAGGGEGAKQIFVTMGEESASLHLVQRLRDYLDVPAVAPTLNEVVSIDF